MTGRNSRGLLAAVALVLPRTLMGQTVDLVHSLDVPASWSRRAEGPAVVVAPNDLPRGASLRLAVVPPSSSGETLRQAYERTCRELGVWSPIGDPVDQQNDTGWVFRQGVAEVIVGGRRYIGLVVIARKGERLARFWALADKLVIPDEATMVARWSDAQTDRALGPTR